MSGFCGKRIPVPADPDNPVWCLRQEGHPPGECSSKKDPPKPLWQPAGGLRRELRPLGVGGYKPRRRIR